MLRAIAVPSILVAVMTDGLPEKSRLEDCWYSLEAFGDRDNSVVLSALGGVACGKPRPRVSPLQIDIGRSSILL
jgi:hypothetical protein